MKFEYMNFECMHCSKMFERKWFDISRAHERVHYKRPVALDEVETADSEGIGTFCSQECMDLGRTSVMNEQGIPIPATRPDIGPIEACAKCSRPVDMSHWHLTFTDGCYEETVGGIKVRHADYIAVVCRECEACGGAPLPAC